MTGCDDVRLLLVLGRPLDAGADAHLRGCAVCRADESLARALAAALAADVAPDPPPGLAARVLRAAAVPLAAHARRAVRPDWRAVARALGAALLPLPVVLYLDALLVRGTWRVAGTLLPGALGAWVTVSYAATLALLLALAYAAVPVLADRLRPWPPEERHA